MHPPGVNARRATVVISEVRFMRHRQPCVSLFAAFIVARFFCLSAMAIGAETTAKTIQTVPGMPAVVDPKNLYSETRPENLSPGRSGAQ